MRSYYMNNVVTGALRGPFTGDEEKEYNYPWVVEETKGPVSAYCAEPGCVEDVTPPNKYCETHTAFGQWRDAPAKPQLKEQSPPRAQDILAAAAEHMMDRAATYDQPQGERSIHNTVAMFNVLTGAGLTDEQGWLFMTCLKMVRAQQGRYRADSYEDGAAYFALAGESAAQERV